MTNLTFRKVWPTSLLLLSMVTLAPRAGHAQAWLPDRGRGTLYLGYEYAQAHWTLFPNDMTGVPVGPYTGGPDNKLFQGEHYGQFVTVDLDYGVLQDLAATAHLAAVSSKFDGTSLHNEPSGQIVRADDGHYHSSFQDAEVGLHPMVLSQPFVATPFVAYHFPLRNYETFGHAAVGHHLRELRIGAALARTLRPFLPDAYGQVTYAYSTAEREDNHSIHRNSVDTELGYFVTPRLSLKGAASWIRSSGGIEWEASSSRGNLVLGDDFYNHFFSHDALANERSWRVGGGAGYALRPRYTVYMAGFATVSGANTHATNTFATGVG